MPLYECVSHGFRLQLCRRIRPGPSTPQAGEDPPQLLCVLRHTNSGGPIVFLSDSISGAFQGLRSIY